MGHADVKTTEIYTHVMKNDIDSVKSPLDLIFGQSLSSPGQKQEDFRGQGFKGLFSKDLS